MTPTPAILFTIFAGTCFHNDVIGPIEFPDLSMICQNSVCGHVVLYDYGSNLAAMTMQYANSFDNIGCRFHVNTKPYV